MIAVNFTLPFGYWAVVPIFWTVLGLCIAVYLSWGVRDFQSRRAIGGMYIFCWLCTAGSAMLARYLP